MTADRVWAAIAGLAVVLCGATSWGWMGERESHHATRVELAKAQATLSAQVPPDPMARKTSAPATTFPCPPAAAPGAAGELGELAARLEAAEADRDRFRAGLEDAVAELNSLNRKHQAELASARAGSLPGAAQSRSPRGKVVPLSDPFLTPMGDQMTITGKLYNVGDADAEVTCVLELLQDGRRIDETRFVMRVSAGATQPYSQTFRYHPGREGAYSARLRIE